jgi:hypothetical protein
MDILKNRCEKPRHSPLRCNSRRTVADHERAIIRRPSGFIRRRGANVSKDSAGTKKTIPWGLI